MILRSAGSRYDHRVHETTAAVLICVGAATGLIGSLLGIGGGVLLVPLLTLMLGVPLRAAVGMFRL